MARPVYIHRLRASFILLAAFAGAGFQACAPIEEDSDAESLENASASEVVSHGEALSIDGSCSSQQWDAIYRANQGANWLLDNALENFNTPENGSLRVKWFGSNMQTVDGNTEILFRIADIRLYANGSLPVTIRCEPDSEPKCVPRSYAYHLPNEDIIHMCPFYFTFDHNQGDYNHVDVSQVGGLLHELSHLDGTDDNYGFFYGYDSCRSLATTSSDTAMNNADTWRYYLMQVQ